MGIVTDSYFNVAEIVRRRVFADFCVAHPLQFRQGKATGRLQLCPTMQHHQGCPHHACCKVNVLLHLLERWELSPEDVLAVGDGLNDICLLRAAGQSYAFQPKSPLVAAAAQAGVVMDMQDLLAAVVAGAVEDRQPAAPHLPRIWESHSRQSA